MDLPVSQRNGYVQKQMVFYLILILFSEPLPVHGHENKTIECAEVMTRRSLGTFCQSECLSNCMCTLTEDAIVNNCTDGNVLKIPVLYPVEMVTWLTWGYNTLHKVKPGAFKIFSRTLEELDLTGNSLQTIEAGVFDDLGNLERLYLGGNALRTIEAGVFDGLGNLEELELDGNALQTIEAGVFDGLANLKRLELWGNALQTIEAGVFDELVNLEVLVLSENALQTIEAGVFDDLGNLERLFLGGNALRTIEAGVFDRLANLKSLYLRENALQTIEAGVFDSIVSLQALLLYYNSLRKIAPNAFGMVRNLVAIYLDHNELTILHLDTFRNQTQLELLRLQNNKLYYLPETIFHSLTNLKYLDLSVNKLNSVPLLSKCTSIETIHLKQNPLMWIERQALSGLHEDVTLFVTSHATCCYASSVSCKSDQPRSPFLTCTRMLASDFLRIIMWFMSAFGIFGNVFALYTKCAHKKDSNKVQFLLITNLSISDLAMCIYLVILLSADAYYTDFFPSSSENWRNSMLCRLAGAISVLSSEVSAFLITLISIDRFLGIKYPFGGCRLGTKLARILVIMLWLIAFSLTVTTFILSGRDSRVYSISEVCVGLPISKLKFYSETSVRHVTEILSYEYVDSVLQVEYIESKVSMYLSIAMFTGLNLVCFSIVGFCYTLIFISARKTTRASGRSRASNEEMRMALKVSLIVLTDFLCWVPVGILSILVQAGAVEVSPVAYAWIATFVLPINSIINPFLYTFSGVLFDPKKWPCCKRRRQEENIQMRQIAR